MNVFTLNRKKIEVLLTKKKERDVIFEDKWENHFIQPQKKYYRNERE